MKSKFVLGFVMISMVVLLTSCAKVPQEELNTLTAAIEDARVTGADVYLPTDFAALQDSLNAINTAIEAQKGKLFGSFKVVKQKIADLTTAAATVKGNVQAKKDEVKVECDTLMAQLTKMVGEAKGLVTKAPKGKEGAAALAAINTEIGAVEAVVTEAAGKLTAGDFMAALNQLKSAKDRITAVTTELNDAIAKYKGKR